MTKIPDRITGILLAGGSSKRMGHDKGMIKVDNMFLYQYPMRILEEFCDEILVSSCKDSGFLEKYTRVCDEIQGAGPMGGIYSCLKQSANELNIILSCDLPLVNTGLMRHLILESKRSDIVVPAMAKDKPEPLCGIYRKNVDSSLHHLINNKDLAVHSVFKLVRSRIILLDRSLPFYHPDLFLNINTPEDLEKFKQCKNNFPMYG